MVKIIFWAVMLYTKVSREVAGDRAKILCSEFSRNSSSTRDKTHKRHHLTVVRGVRGVRGVRVQSSEALKREDLSQKEFLKVFFFSRTGQKAVTRTRRFFSEQRWLLGNNGITLGVFFSPCFVSANCPWLRYPTRHQRRLTKERRWGISLGI